jgi:hypothetical protein
VLKIGDKIITDYGSAVVAEVLESDESHCDFDGFPRIGFVIDGCMVWEPEYNVEPAPEPKS